MSWSLGFDTNWNRWIGYGVPAYCDHPNCNNVIDRGLAYVCRGQQPYGGEDGCGLYFCSEHSGDNGKCERCEKGRKPFKPKPEHPKWVKHLLNDKSWKQWREENPELVKELNKL
jgi:hypothetical protein